MNGPHWTGTRTGCHKSQDHVRGIYLTLATVDLKTIIIFAILLFSTDAAALLEKARAAYARALEMDPADAAATRAMAAVDEKLKAACEARIATAMALLQQADEALGRQDFSATAQLYTAVIELYAKQFNWTARYSGDDNTLGKANFKLVKGLNELGVNMEDENAADDIITREVHLVVDQPVLLKLRSQDVIHSAFLPHFRVQMNCVPGMSTQFGFIPTQTTEEMKEQEGKDFEFVLLCNKICGAAHYNMKMKFIVESQEEYDAWIASQKNLKNTLTLK